MRLLFILVLFMSPLNGLAENEKQIFQLEKALMRVQQDAQAIHQQFLMIQELRRNELQGSPLTGVPNANVPATAQSMPTPKYEEMLQRQQERNNRIEEYTTDLDRLYTRFRALEDERQMLMEQINQLEQQSGE